MSNVAHAPAAEAVVDEPKEPVRGRKGRKGMKALTFLSNHWERP